MRGFLIAKDMCLLLVRENISIDSIGLCNFAVYDVRLFYTVEVTSADYTKYALIMA